MSIIEYIPLIIWVLGIPIAAGFLIHQELDAVVCAFATVLWPLAVVLVVLAFFAVALFTLGESLAE